MAKKPKTAKEKPKKYYITSKEVIRFRALLMLKLERDIKWNEYADMMGMSQPGMSHIANGRVKGGRITAMRIIERMREYGVVVHLSDLQLD